ncbi:MAG: phage terminase large subunit family protein, partial [Candidatus Heimdallarchaeota archaeon]|nr:phage terminase large subunit family protein [Candidatus Heimdallarchaeota archaeon]
PFANALGMYFTSLETMADEVIQAEQTGNYETLAQVYLDYFNEYYDLQTETVEKNEILTLSNGLKSKTLPKDTYRVYMGIDTQKDHFWYVIDSYSYGNISNTVMHGRVETTGELEIIMGLQFDTEDGRKMGIDRVGVDRLGNRTTEVDAWVEHLIVNEGLEDFIYLTMGFSGSSSIKPFEEFTLIKDLTTNERRAKPLKGFKLNNKLLKNSLNSRITRTIKKVKGDDEDAQDFETKLFYINQDIVDIAEATEKSITTDYENQMTSEEYIRKRQKNGTYAKEESWEKKAKGGKHNHIWDCHVTCEGFSVMDNISSVKKPSNDSVLDLLDDL